VRRSAAGGVWRGSGVLLAAVLALGLSRPSFARPPIWIVHGGRGVAVLFGSIHLLPPGLDWRSAALDAAIARANELWFELPITAASDDEAEALSRARGRLAGGRTLASLLTPRAAGALQRAALKVRCPPQALAPMQPWLAELTLSVAEVGLDGATAYNGVEEQIQAIAPIGAKRRAFETARQQIDILAGAARQDQVASLSLTVHEIDDEPGVYRRIVNDWMTADLPALRRDALDPLAAASPAIYARLITRRNRRWTERLKRRLRHPGLIVVVVGVGHLVGPDGLPSQLRARGFDVEGP